MQDIGEKIRIQRLTKKYSQEYMAWELGISQPAYSKIERDETELTISRIYEIAKILEISPFTLLPPPMQGSAIAVTYYKMLAKFRTFWRKVTRTRTKKNGDSYNVSKGH